MTIALNPNFANNLHNTLDRKAVSPKPTASPFRDYLASTAAPTPEKISPVIGSAAGKAAEFDPFSVVRSGAVPENNAFVLALKRLYGLVVDPSPAPQIPGAINLDTNPAEMKNDQAKQARIDSPPAAENTPDPITFLPQLISNTVEHSAVTTANQEIMDAVLQKLS